MTELDLETDDLDLEKGGGLDTRKWQEMCSNILSQSFVLCYTHAVVS